MVTTVNILLCRDCGDNINRTNSSVLAAGSLILTLMCATSKASCWQVSNSLISEYHTDMLLVKTCGNSGNEPGPPE